VIKILLYYYPHILAVIFLFVFLTSRLPRKEQFFWRAMLALVLATFLAHVNRIFDIWPAYRLFPSGHMTFCLGVSISLGLLRPWTLAITLPVLVPFGMAMVAWHFHSALDVWGAMPLVLIVYGIVHGLWPLPSSPPLDRATVSS
jgi:hypothetical protein